MRKETRDTWKHRAIKKKFAGLERDLKGQQLEIELLFEFATSVAHADGKNLFTYQQFHSPSAESNENVLMLIQEMLKLR